MKCNVCKKDCSTVSLQPSRKQLLFGGFRVSYEYRCNKCEKRVKAWITTLMK